jgi:DNA-binding CsgD family transcriptional regulator
VDLLGRYSNPLDGPIPTLLFEAADLQELLQLTPVRRAAMAEDRPPRQHQRRLRQDELDHLVADYRSGIKVKELAECFRITRQTVLEHMRRQSVPRRHPRLGPLDVNEACDLYRSGKSLADIGAVFSVDPGTVRRALTKVGVPMRDPHGRERA